MAVGSKLSSAFFTVHRHHFELVVNFRYSLYKFRELARVYNRGMRVLSDRFECENWGARITHRSDNSAVSPCRDITPRSSISLFDIPCSEELFFLQENGSDIITATFSGPNDRAYIFNRVDDIEISVIAYRPMWALRRVADDGYSRID